MNDQKQKKPVIEDNKKVEIEKILKELEEIRKQAQDYKNKYLRALADYQNFEKRINDDRQQLKQIVNKGLILKLLPFLDNLDKAEIFIKDNGLKMIKDHFYSILRSEGLEEIDSLGKEYDPYIAEVVDMVEGKQDNIIVDVLRKGYKYNGNIIRVAQVKVSKKKSEVQNPKS